MHDYCECFPEFSGLLSMFCWKILYLLTEKAYHLPVYFAHRTQSTYKQNYHRAETKTEVHPGRRTSFNLLCKGTLTERHSPF